MRISHQDYIEFILKPFVCYCSTFLHTLSFDCKLRVPDSLTYVAISCLADRSSLPRLGSYFLNDFACTYIQYRCTHAQDVKEFKYENTVYKVEVAVGVLPGEKEVGAPSIGYKTKDDGRHLFRPIIIRLFVRELYTYIYKILVCLLSIYRINYSLAVKTQRRREHRFFPNVREVRNRLKKKK